jgi:hypothetical protein
MLPKACNTVLIAFFQNWPCIGRKRDKQQEGEQNSPPAAREDLLLSMNLIPL